MYYCITGNFSGGFNLAIEELIAKLKSPTFCHVCAKIAHRNCGSLCLQSQKHDGEMLVQVGSRPYQ